MKQGRKSVIAGLGILLMLTLVCACRPVANGDAEPVIAPVEPLSPTDKAELNLCEAEGCSETVWRTDHSFCQRHICMYGDCDNQRMEGDDTRYCSEHSYVALITPPPELCAWEGCIEPAQWGNYCKEHVCKFGDCTNARTEDISYCQEHEN